MSSVTRPTTATATARAQGEDARVIEQAIDRATQLLVDRQAKQGYWIGELEADSSLESDYVLLQLWLYPPDRDGTWRPKTQERVDKAANYILSRQMPDGAWNIYPGGEGNVSATVKAYVALKLAGYPADDPRLTRARKRILEMGGVEWTNSYTKIYLSLFGLLDRSKTPIIPPEMFLAPPETGFSVYEMSSWSRTIVAPLAILWAKKAQRPVPAGFSIEEIFTGRSAPKADLVSWRNFFGWVDRGLKLWEKSGVVPTREWAIRATADWMIRRLDHSDGLSAIFPAMLNCIMALTELGYDVDHPLVQREIETFERFVIEDRKTLRLQPCLSPVWDTALATFALGSANPEPEGALPHALERAAEWLLSKEVRRPGDWAVKNREGKPGGWYFEFANEFYPDNDDTAKVLLALRHAKARDTKAQQGAEKRAVAWLLSMQCRDGGWAAFDRDNNNEILTHVPFADHNAMLDPTCPDITGRVLEALCRCGLDRSHPAIARGIASLKDSQEEDGSWFGRWGVNYIYGTCFALRGLRAAGEDPNEAYIIQATEWLRSIQNADGGWGETCDSYIDPEKKRVGDSTPSQTAWALMALMAAGDYQTSSVRDGIRYLTNTQTDNGSWTEEWYTGTGFPRVFYLRYHLYPQYFPLMALGEYSAWTRATG